MRSTTTISYCLLFLVYCKVSFAFSSLPFSSKIKGLSPSSVLFPRTTSSPTTKTGTVLYAETPPPKKRKTGVRKKKAKVATSATPKKQTRKKEKKKKAKTTTKAKTKTTTTTTQQQAQAPPQEENETTSDTKSSKKKAAKAYQLRADVDVMFGSEEFQEYEEGDELEDEEDEYARKEKERLAKIQSLLDEQEEEFREERKQQRWGKYANATSKEDIEALEEEQRQEIAKENEKKAELAKQHGVVLEVLDPKEFSESSSDIWDENGNVQIRAGSAQSSWFKELDKDLEQEWEDMTDGGDTEATIVNGKMVSRDALQGVRVGSAGGWSLEVFPGDFVVHRKYGIGRFEKTCLRPKTNLTPQEREARDERRKELMTKELRSRGKQGLAPEEIQEIRSKFGSEDDKDPISNPQTTVLEIAYADAAVHVPVDRAYRLSRYRAGDSVVKPKLSRVKGEAWAKAKQKVEENTLQLAQDVLALYATRETLTRAPFDPACESKVKKFEETFPFDPTPDQKTCFEHVENDMVWRNRPMDRLCCGDVGFGKTEVALRALYRTVVNGKQAALLAPTGVLAAQHFKNTLKRMGPDTEFNVNVALLRGGMGKNTKAGRELREKIASGEVQLIVGTHALLTQGMEFGDLGLLVVDEEQRFGVKQKERLKLISNGVDVLTLSATPIPRTLQMSLSGIRDTSTIRSPPPMRKPTKSFVCDFSPQVVKEAISRELARGGQCYYVVPRIAQLEDAQQMIESLFPGIRVIQAHGRMPRGGAEENVAEFAEGAHDILLATTVIENGVDIPTVNTIIIQNAQAFGMSTLYQLRGRVGRSDMQAYAYFLPQEEAVTETAALRLQAMGELHELGSGFDVANRDLEIRGAGSLLGTEQSGMAAKVGFDLYMRMLKKSIRQLRGMDLPLVPRTNVLLPGGEGSIEVAGPDGVSHAFKISKSYIQDDDERRKQETATRLSESTAKLVDLTNLWKEQYGPIPAKIQARLKTMHLHACTRRLGIDLVGLIDAGPTDDHDDEVQRKMDCVLRSPGLRPRHLASICKSLPRGVPPKGLNICFPSRFTMTGEDQEIVGGRKQDLDATLLLANDSGLSASNENNDDQEEWDALDEEEVEAMKEISSALRVQAMDEIDVEQYPRFVIPNLVSDVPQGQRVDRLLKLLLPLSKIVYEKQEKDKETARMAANLREKREMMKKKKKEQDAIDKTNFGLQNVGAVTLGDDVGVGSGASYPSQF